MRNVRNNQRNEMSDMMREYVSEYQRTTFFHNIIDNKQQIPSLQFLPSLNMSYDYVVTMLQLQLQGTIARKCVRVCMCIGWREERKIGER